MIPVRIFFKILITSIAHLFRVVYVLIKYSNKELKIKVRQP